VLSTTAFVFAVPVPTTHTITSALVTAWVLTIPAAALVARVFDELARLVVL